MGIETKNSAYGIFDAKNNMATWFLLLLLLLYAFRDTVLLLYAFRDTVSGQSVVSQSVVVGTRLMMSDPCC